MTTDRITFNPKLLRGKPCVRGIRSPVATVMEILEDGITFAQIVMDYYPQLTPDDIHAYLEYANIVYVFLPRKKCLHGGCVCVML